MDNRLFKAHVRVELQRIHRRRRKVNDHKYAPKPPFHAIHFRATLNPGLLSARDNSTSRRVVEIDGWQDDKLHAVVAVSLLVSILLGCVPVRLMWVSLDVARGDEGLGGWWNHGERAEEGNCADGRTNKREASGRAGRHVRTVETGSFEDGYRLVRDNDMLLTGEEEDAIGIPRSRRI
jgi:hypothetical protein